MYKFILGICGYDYQMCDNLTTSLFGNVQFILIQPNCYHLPKYKNNFDMPESYDT